MSKRGREDDAEAEGGGAIEAEEEEDLFTPVTTKPSAKAKAGGKAKSKGTPQQELLLLLSMLSLNNAQNVRELVGCCFQTFLIPAKHALLTMISRVGKDYHQATKGQSGHGKGPPCVHLVPALLRFLVASSKVGAAHKGRIEKWLSDNLTAETTIDNIYMDLRYFKVKKTADAAKKRISLQIRDDALAADVALAMTDIGAEGRLGSAPQGHMEKRVSELLQQLKE